MDLETENIIASMLLKEAAELRRQAQQEGVLAYLKKPTVRGRPNSRFLTTTIRGIEQANRAVEMKEMWGAREKEREMDVLSRNRHRDEGSCGSRETDIDLSRSRSKRHDSNVSCSSSNRLNHLGEDNGLKDEELEEFLQSRAKRGRGSVGPRMDETGPYLPPSSDSRDASFLRLNDERPREAILGPKNPYSSKRYKSSDDESDEKQRRSKKGDSGGSGKRSSKKHKSKDRDKKKKRKEKHHRH